MNNPFQFQPANMNVGMAGRLQMPMQGQGRPGASNTLQQISRIVMGRQQQRPPETGWRQTISPQERAVLIFQIATQLQLVKGSLSVEQAIKEALNFEASVFNGAESKEQWSNACQTKLKEIHHHRQEQAKAQMQANNAQNVQMGGMPGQNVMQSVMPAQNQFQQSGFPHPQLQQQMQPSPIPRQPQQQPQPVGGAHNISNLPNQVAPPPQFQNVMAQPSMGLQGGQKVEALTPQEVHYCQELVKQQRQLLTQADIEKIKADIQQFDPRQTQMLRKSQMDPIDYYLRTKIVRSYQQKKIELAVERARQQLQVQQQRQSQQGGMNNTSALNDLSGMGAGPTLSRGLQPQGLAGGPQPTVSGAGNFDNFLTGVHDMVGQQQATALELQKQGHPVVPANTGNAGKQPIAGNAPQMGQAPLNQKLNPGQIRPMPNMGGPTSQQQQQQNNFLAMQSQQTNARPQAAQLNPRVQSQDETRAQAQAQQAQQAHLEAQGRAAAAQAQASNQGFLRGQPGGMTPQIGTRIAQSPAMPNLNQPLRTPVPQSQQPQQKTPQQRPQHHQAPVVMPTRQPFDAGPPQQSQQPVQPGTIAGNPPMNMSGGSTAGRLPPTVSKEWILNMLQAGQISRDQARAYIVRLQQQPQQQPSAAPQNPANMQPMPPNSLQMGPQSLAGLPHMSQQMQQPNPHHGQPNHTMGAQNPNFFPTQPSTQQQLARAIQIQQSLITATSLTPEREREMDLKEFPPNIVNASNSLPESIRTWGQLKQWAANNPTFHMQGQLERIQLFFSQELARRQMAEYQSRLPVHLRQAFSQPGQQPGPQFQPSRMNLDGQPPGARPQPITQGQNTDSPMRKPTPEEIKAFKEKLIQKMPNITDDQVMNFVLQRMAANTQPQQRNPANIQRPIGGTEQTFSRRQPDFNPIQQGLWNESQQFQRPDPPPMQPQNSQSSASGKAGRGQMNPNPPTQDQKPAGHALPPTQPRKNLKRPSPDHVNEKLPTERSGQPSRQLPPQQPTAQKQIQKSDLEIKVEKKMYQLSMPWIKSTRQIVEREIIAMSMKPKRKIVQMNINEKGEMARVLQNLKRVQLDRLSRNLHFVYGELGENMVRQYQQMRMVLEQQFPKQAGGDPANLNFTISLDDLRQYVSKIDGLMQLFLEKHKAFHKSCMDSVQGQSSQQPGQSQPHNVNQGIPPQQQQQAEGRSLPLNAKNLQQHQEEFKNQRQQIPHKAAVRGNQAPAAPTSSKPPFGFSAASPQGVPVYASNEQPVQPKLPPAKKRKGNQGGSTASTPANNQPTPTAVTSPKLLKVNSPQANRKVGPEATKPPAEAQSTFKCPVAACDSHNAPFKTELDLKKHIFDVHEPKEPPIRDPLKFALETVASTVGLNQDGTRKQVKEPTASQPMARTPSKLSQALKSKPSAGPLARAATQTASSYKMSPSPSQQKGTPQGAPNKPPTSSAMQAGGGSKQSKTASPDKSSDKEPTSQQSTPPSLLWADSSISPEDMRRCFEGMAGLPGLSTKEDFSSLSSAHTPSTDSKTSPGRASDIGEGDKLMINLAGSVAGDGDKAVKDLDLDVNMDMDLDGLGDGHKMDWFSMADPGAEFMGAPAGGVGLEGGIEKLDMEEDLSWWADLGESYGDATQEEDMLFGDQGVFGLML